MSTPDRSKKSTNPRRTQARIPFTFQLTTRTGSTSATPTTRRSPLVERLSEDAPTLVGIDHDRGENGQARALPRREHRTAIAQQHSVANLAYLPAWGQFYALVVTE